jgi:hypothetical protein
MGKLVTYSVDTLAQMAEIPEEAWPRFIAELPLMLRGMRDTKALLLLAGLTESEFRPGPAKWTDDGDTSGVATIKCGDEELLRIEIGAPQ